MFFRKSASGLAGKMPVKRGSSVEPRRVVRIGRNDPCPCGSNKKYKNCHEAQGDAFLAKLAREREIADAEARQKEAGVSWLKRWLHRNLKA